MNPYLLGICGYAIWKLVSAIVNEADENETSKLVDNVKKIGAEGSGSISMQTLRLVQEYERRKKAEESK